MENQLSGVLSRLLSFDREQLPKLDIEFKSKAEIIENVGPEIYFSDRTRINSSSIKKIIRSPRHFLTDWKDENNDKEEPDHFRIGRAAHLFLLEPNKFKELHVVEPEFIGITKDGKPTKSNNSSDVKKQREEWKAQQRPDALILSESELNHLVGMIECVIEHPISRSMLKNGIAESTIKWTDRETGVMCRGRPDYVTFEPNGDYHLIDFKTTQNTQPGSFMKDTNRLQYHLSMAFYADGLMEVYGRLPTSISFFAVEKLPPYEATVFVCEDEWHEIGQRMYRDGLKIYRKCLESGSWPSYSSTAQTLKMPEWAQDYVSPTFEF